MITLQFSEQDMAVLDAAITALPYRTVAPLVASISQQIAKQREQQAAEAEGEKS